MNENDILKALSNVHEPDLGKDIVTLNMVKDIKIDGDNVSFKDSSERDWGFKDRTFASLSQCSWEVSRSRFYGGIHYIPSIHTGHQYGLIIGKDVAAVQLTE